MTVSDILLVISLGIVVIWTSRLAHSKGLNPWLWAIGSVLLIAIAWTSSRQFLGVVVMAPLVFLLLYRSPLFRRNRMPASMPCPRCGAAETGGLNFCVQCGWDLSQTYADSPQADAGNPLESDSTPAETPTAATPEAAAQEPREKEPAAEEITAPVFPTSREESTEAESPGAVEPPPAPEREQEPETQPAAEPVLAMEAMERETEPAAAPEPPPASAPTPQPQARRIPTAANMTERGIALFSQGRFQEAVDQFTKAIALDPKYRLAWERRAEAYGRLGRRERQAADQQHLEAI